MSQSSVAIFNSSNFVEGCEWVAVIGQVASHVRASVDDDRSWLLLLLLHRSHYRRLLAIQDFRTSDRGRYEGV